MKSPKNYLILLLAITSIAGSVLAWRQYAELVELRAAAMNRDERADLQKRVWDLEKANRELRDQLARHDASVDGLVAGAEGDRPGSERGGRGERGGPGRGPAFQQQANAIRELMNKPEVQAMINLQQKSAIESRYAALFKNLNLAPAQIEKLTSLLAERSTTMQDVMNAARDQGINPRENPDAFRKLIADAQNEINNSIKSVIGDQGLAQLTNYEQTLPQRNLVNELQQRLSYTNTPLTAEQSEQLVQVLASTAPQRQLAVNATGQQSAAPGSDGGRGPGGGPGFGGRGGDFGGIMGAVGGPGLGMLMGGMEGGRGGGAASVTNAAVAQAQTILAPSQVAVLQQIQQQQQAQQQLRQLVSETLSANQPSAPPAASTPPPPRRGGG